MTRDQAGWLNRILGCVLAGSAAVGVAQTSAPHLKDDLFAGTEKFAQGATSVTQIDMDPDTLSEVKGKDSPQARRMALSIVHTYAYDKPGMYKIEDVEAFRKKLESSDWHCSVHIREMKTGESTDVCNKRRDDGLSETAIITVEPKSLTFIHTIGKASWSKSSVGWSLPAQIGPQMQAEMAVMRAEMAATMPQLRLEMEQMKGFQGPDPEEMKRLREELKGLDLGKKVAP